MAVLKYYNNATSAWEYIAASTTANFTTWKKTATGGETSVSGTDDNAVTLSYTAGLEQVFINGVLQVRGSDYTATTGTSVTGLTALVAGDIVTVVCYAPFNVANTIAPTLVDAKGDLIAGTAADTVGRLAVGTNGQLLSAASGETTGLKWLNGGMTLINTTSFSGATTASVNNVFSSTYKNYFVILFVQECVNAGNFAFRLRASGTDSSGSVYNSMCYGTDTAGTIDVKSAGLTSGQFFNTGAGVNYEWHATMMFGNPFEARYTQVNTIAVGRRNGGNYASYSGGVQHSLATSYDGFTLLNTSGGNIAGTVSVYGINN